MIHGPWSLILPTSILFLRIISCYRVFPSFLCRRLSETLHFALGLAWVCSGLPRRLLWSFSKPACLKKNPQRGKRPAEKAKNRNRKQTRRKIPVIPPTTLVQPWAILGHLGPLSVPPPLLDFDTWSSSPPVAPSSIYGCRDYVWSRGR